MIWKRVFGFLLVIVILVDLALVNFGLYKVWNKPTEVVNQVSKCNECPIIEPTAVPTAIVPTPTVIKVAVPVVKKERVVSYVPITGSGETKSNQWTDIAGTDFYLDTGDYLTIKEAYFEANIKLFNGNGFAYARLFDVTAGVEVWGSEIQTSSQSYVVAVSGNLTLRAGKHLYRVQAKSLTADTAMFNAGKIKIIN